MNRTLLATAIVLALAATPAAFGKGKPTPEEEYGNNLSFPTKFVPAVPVSGEGTFLRLNCSETPTNPTGAYCNLFPGYWCQKTAATWQAACTTGPDDLSVFVTATWGANLLGGNISAGKPIRVEMVLTESGGTSDNPGYVVVKLTDELDRLATYGTDGTTQLKEYTVLDDGATLTIETCGNLACDPPTGTILPAQAFTPEINSLGNVVYGYNWGTKGRTNTPAAGIYKLTFTANGTTIASVPGAQRCSDGSCAFVIIEVKQSSGGGGGPPNRP